MKEVERGMVRGFSHFVHCACPRFDNARLARRHESDPRRPLSLIFHRCTLELSRLNPDYDAGIDNRLLLKGLKLFQQPCHESLYAIYMYSRLKYHYFNLIYTLNFSQ